MTIRSTTVTTEPGEAKVNVSVNDNDTANVLECDYLVVGAGTAGMSFIDTILTENPRATVIVVDLNSKAGGHWNHAYPYVRLHQPSCYYGINSLRLGKSRFKNGNERYDAYDLATGQEILDYYQTACDQFAKTGRFRSFWQTEYRFDETRQAHTIRVANETVYTVQCRKLVTCASKVIVPSMRKPLIPVHESLGDSFVPLNELPQKVSTGRYSSFVVFGCGKSGMDAICHLVLDQGIDPSQITWIIPRDVWFVDRDGIADFFEGFQRFFVGFQHPTSLRDTFLKWEKAGVIGRLNNNHSELPTVFKGPTIQKRDIEAIRSIPNQIRRGRAVSIEADRIVFGTYQPSLAFDPQTTLLVDCMVENAYGYKFPSDFTIFEPGKINLGPFLAFFNFSLSSAMIAFLECALDDDDDAKNNHCIFLRGRYSETIPEYLMGAYYMHIKSADAFSKVPGGLNFLMNSRTNDGGLMHHKGGLVRFLWEFYGPHQLYKVEPALKRAVEGRMFSDLDHSFGIEEFQDDIRKRHETKKPQTSSRKKKGWAQCLGKCFSKSHKKKPQETSTFSQEASPTSL